MSRFARMIRKALVAVIIIAAAASLQAQPAAVGPETGNDRAALLREMTTAFRADDYVRAGIAVDHYLAAWPDDGSVLYNRACVQTRAGDGDAAMASLAAACATGWSDLDRFDVDGDLATLRGRADFAALRDEILARLVETAATSGETLVEEIWSEVRTLRPNNGDATDESTPEVSLRFCYYEGSLAIEATVVADHFNESDVPWHQGDALFVDIVIPPEAGSFAGERFFSFAFGVENAAPTGLFVSRHGQRVDQRVMQLSPKIRFFPRERLAVYNVLIPWPTVAPYAPPLDAELGLNVLYATVGPDGIRRVVSLVSTPNSLTRPGQMRRFARFRFEQGDESRPTLRGRPNTTIVGTDPLQIDLVSWSPETGDGNLEVRILDARGISVVSSGPGVETVPMDAGLNEWTREADLSALPSGPFSVEVNLVLPDGSKARWNTHLLRLDDGWLAGAAESVLETHRVERPQLRSQYEMIADALEKHDPRDDPTPLARAIIDLSLQLDRTSESGSVLPDSGTVAIGWPGAGGEVLPAALQLPVGFDREQPHRLLLVLSGSRGDQQRLANSVDLEGRPDLVVMVPQPPAEGLLRDDEVLFQTGACVDWWREHLRVEEILIAGLEHGAADALRLSLRQPDLATEVLLITGPGFEFLRGRDADGIRRVIATTPNHVAYHHVDYGGGQGALVAEALDAASFSLRRRQVPPAQLTPSLIPGLIDDWIDDLE